MNFLKTNMEIRATKRFAFIAILPSIMIYLAITLLLGIFVDIDYSMIFFFIAFCIICYQFFLIRSKVYKFLETNLIVSSGVFSRTKNYLEYYRIIDFQESQNTIEMIVRVKKIVIISTDAIHKKTILKGINNKVELIPDLRLRVNEARSKSRVFEPV